MALSIRVMERGYRHIGMRIMGEWNHRGRDGMTTEEKRKEIVSEIAKLRQEQGMTQKRLEELSGVKQPVIARIERGANIPQLSTIIKLLVPLGKTLAVVPIDK